MDPTLSHLEREKEAENNTHSFIYTRGRIAICDSDDSDHRTTGNDPSSIM